MRLGSVSEAWQNRGASTAPTITWQFCLDAVPHTVLGTNAGRVSCQWWRPSTPGLRRRAGWARGWPSVPVRAVSLPGGRVQLL